MCIDSSKQNLYPDNFKTTYLFFNSVDIFAPNSTQTVMDYGAIVMGKCNE